MEDYVQVIEDQGWEPIVGQGLAKAQSFIGHNNDLEMWAKKFGRKTVFLRYTGIVKLYVIDDQGFVHTDRSTSIRNLDRLARDIIARAYGQLSSSGKANPGPRTIIQASVNPSLFKVLKQIFAKDFISFFGSKFDVDVLRWGKETSGDSILFWYPQQVSCIMRDSFDGLPPNSDARVIERVVKYMIGRTAQKVFQQSLLNDDDMVKMLNDSVNAEDGAISGIRWQVEHADCKKVRAVVREDRAQIEIQVLLDLSVDVRDSDQNQYRDAALRSNLVRIAHTHPSLQRDILPLLVQHSIQAT